MKRYIWGTSVLAERVLAREPMTVDAFVDSNQAKWGGRFHGKPIVAPDSIDPHTAEIVIASIYYPDIYAAARALGVLPAQISIASEAGLLSASESADLISQHIQHQKWIKQITGEEMSGARDFADDREAHLRFACDHATGQYLPEGSSENPADSGAIELALEFGVFEGQSIKILAERLQQRVTGFDTFEGLPETWTQFHQKGFFDLGGTLPDVGAANGANVHLIKGLFEDTLVNFLAANDAPLRLIHCDADLYASTAFVLAHIAPRIRVGTVMIFDDFLYPLDYERCDYRAFKECAEDHKLGYRYLSREASGSVSLVVTQIG